MLAVTELPGVVVDDTEASAWGTGKFPSTRSLTSPRGYIHDMDMGKGDKTLSRSCPSSATAGTYEVWLAYSAGVSRAKAVPVAILSADGDTMVSVDMSANPPIDGRYLSLGRFRFESNGQGYVMISNEGTTGHVTADAVLFVPTNPGQRGPAWRNRSTKRLRENAKLLARLETQLKQLKANGPTRELFLGVEEVPAIEEIRVHIRGSVHTLGEPVTRGVLSVATYGEAPTMSSHEVAAASSPTGWLTSRTL